MIPACPNNLLLMALVFWCAAFGATINDSEMDEHSDNNDSNNNSCHDGSSLPCHNTSDCGGNYPFDNRTGNADVPDVGSYKYYQDVKDFEVVLLLRTGPITTIIIPSFYTAVCLLSVPANICALLVFLRRIKPLNPAVIYMLNLAFADLLFAMVLPFKISYHFKGNDWIFGEAMCRLVTAAFYWNMFCSILLITLISVDRLLAVVYPMDSLSWRSPRKAFIGCAAIWALSSAGSVHNLFTDQTFRVNELNITICHYILPVHVSEFYRIYCITLCVFLFILPLIITVVSFTWVIKTLTKDQPGVPDASGRKRRAAMLTKNVLALFVLNLTPMKIFLIIFLVVFSKELPMANSNWLYVVYSYLLCSGSLNCVFDTLVYYFGSTPFQKEVCSLLWCKKAKQGTGSGHTSPGQINPVNTTQQPNTKSDCE